MGLTTWLNERKKKKKDLLAGQLAGQLAARDAERKVTVALDTYEGLCTIFGSMIRFFLGQSNTEQKIIATWEMFANGLEPLDILALCEKSGLDMRDQEILAILKASEATRKYATTNTGDWKFYVNHKTLLEIFFAILDGSAGVNVLSDYLEENNYMTEDGMAVWDFRKGTTKRVIGNYSHLYEKVEYDPETGGVKAGT